MSQQPRMNLSELEINWHDAKANTDAMAATLIRELKGKIINASNEVFLLRKQVADLTKKDVKSAESPKKD